MLVLTKITSAEPSNEKVGCQVQKLIQKCQSSIKSNSIQPRDQVFINIETP